MALMDRSSKLMRYLLFTTYVSSRV